MYAAELFAADNIELYAESTRILFYIFGSSLLIAVFGMIMNRINVMLSVHKKEKKFQDQSVVFMNRRSHEVKGYNGGSYHIDIVNENKLIKSAGIEELREYLLKLSFRSCEGRLREVDRWRKNKFATAIVREAINIVIKRIDKNVQSTEQEITLQDVLRQQEYIKVLKEMNELVSFGNLDDIETVISNYLVVMREKGVKKNDLEVDLYRNAANKFLVFGQLDKAILFFEKAGERRREIAGTVDEIFAECLNDLGYCHHLAENHDKALACHENALVVYTHVIGANRLEIGLTHNAIGISHVANSEYEKALKHHFYALPILLKNFGDKYPSVAATYGNIALALSGSKLYARALEYYQKAIAIDQEFFGKSHKSIAIYYNLLGLAQYQLHQIDDAIASFKKSLEVAEKAYDSEHPTIATICNNLGGVLYAIENYEEAIKYYDRALSINVQIFSETDETIAINLGNLGSAWKKKGGFVRAVEYYKNALAIELSHYGEMHAVVATTYDNLGGALRGKGDFNEALNYKKKALDINLKLFGEEHLNVVICYHGLAKTYEAMSDLEKAREYYEKNLALNLTLNGDDNIHVARGYASLGRIAYLQKQIKNTEEYYEQAIAIYKKIPESNVQIIETYGLLSDALSDLGDAKKALLMAEKAHEILTTQSIGKEPLASMITAKVQIMKERLAVS